MKRFLLPFVMMLVFSAESIFTDLVHFPFVTDDQVLAPRFLMLVLIFMSTLMKHKNAMIDGFGFGVIYEMHDTSLLGVYMFGFAGLCYLASKAFKVLHTNAFVVILIAVLAVCLLEFYVFGIQSLIHKDIMTFNGFVLDRFIPTILLNIAAALILVLPFRLFFMSLKKELRDE